MHIAGKNAVIAALESGQIIRKVFIKKSSASRFEKLIEELRGKTIPVSLVPAEKLNRLYRQGNHGGIIAEISPVTFQSLETIIKSAFEQTTKPVFLLLDGITDTRNLGAIIRSAAAFGVNGVILPAHRSAAVSGETVKMSAGAIFKMPMVRVNHLKDAVFYLQAEGVEIVAATEKTSNKLSDHSFEKPIGLIMGDEHKGIGSFLLKQADSVLKIPMESGVDSLNVSVATAIFLYEIYRRKLSFQSK